MKKDLQVPEEKAKSPCQPPLSLGKAWVWVPAPSPSHNLSLRFALKFPMNVILILSQGVITKKVSDLLKPSAVYLNPYNIIPGSYLASAQTLKQFLLFSLRWKKILHIVKSILLLISTPILCHQGLNSKFYFLFLMTVLVLSQTHRHPAYFKKLPSPKEGREGGRKG